MTSCCILCILGNFACFFYCFLFFFFQNELSEKFLQESHQSVKQFGSISACDFVGPEMCQNCLQRLSADDTSRQKVKL